MLHLVRLLRLRSLSVSRWLVRAHFAYSGKTCGQVDCPIHFLGSLWSNQARNLQPSVLVMWLVRSHSCKKWHRERVPNNQIFSAKVHNVLIQQRRLAILLWKACGVCSFGHCWLAMDERCNCAVKQHYWSINLAASMPMSKNIDLKTEPKSFQHSSPYAVSTVQQINNLQNIIFYQIAYQVIPCLTVLTAIA